MLLKPHPLTLRYPFPPIFVLCSPRCPKEMQRLREVEMDYKSLQADIVSMRADLARLEPLEGIRLGLENVRPSFLCHQSLTFYYYYCFVYIHDTV